VKFTSKPCGAGVFAIHAFQGGGKGLEGKYIEGLTWCGVEKQSSGLYLVPTRKKPTCKNCIRAMRAHERMVESMKAG